jgi:menaquinone-specific isochorismate synthase
LSNPSIEKFVAFITDSSEKLSGKTATTLVSYCFEDGNFQIQKKLFHLSKNYEKFFYWEKPEDNLCFLALGELFSIIEYGKIRFTTTEKKVKNWTDNFYSNWNEENYSTPLFIGGMKFIPESEPDLWENFPDSCWIVPRIIVLKKGKKEFIFYNFLISPESLTEGIPAHQQGGDFQKEKIIEEFKIRITNLYSENHNNIPDTRFKIISSYGKGPKEKKRWIENVKKAIQKIESDTIKKVVLSRYMEFGFDSEPNIFEFIEKFRKKYPECYIFIFHSGKSSFFGASPEKLVKLTADFIETDSLAGSAPRGKDKSEDKLLEEELHSSKKNLYEHKTVIEFIKKQFERMNIQITFNPEPGIKKLHNIQHLFTNIRANINPSGNTFGILENLHPTPAVCGVPTSGAIQVIKEMEDYSRGLYSGIIGWFNFNGEGEFTVAIRSALLKGKKLYTFAGSGIVEGSDPVSEFKETELKFKPILSLIENEEES